MNTQIILLLSAVGDASPLHSQSNGQVRSVKAQKCRFEYCLFSLLSISVYILKILKTVSVANGFLSKTIPCQMVKMSHRPKSE